MELWSVYKESERCVVRKVLVAEDGLRPENDEQRFSTLIEAQSTLARRGLIRVPRSSGDDPGLLETWL